MTIVFDSKLIDDILDIVKTSRKDEFAFATFKGLFFGTVVNNQLVINQNEKKYLYGDKS